jgi:hypothetical protein
VTAGGVGVRAESPAGDEGTAGPVALRLRGDVVAGGEGGVGVRAESRAGNEGTAGDVTLRLWGDVAARGRGGVGIRAGSRVGEWGVAGGVGVAFDGGATNRLAISGLLRTADGLEGLAFSGTDGDDRGVSTGTVMGNLALGDGANAFVNRRAGPFLAGRSLDLGDAGRVFRNEGTLSFGMTGSIDTVQTTAIDGSFVRARGGVVPTDLDVVAGDAASGRIDRLDATGSVDYRGTLSVGIVNADAASPGTRDAVFATGAGGVDVDELVLDIPRSAVAEYEIVTLGANTAALRHAIDFSPEGDSNRSQTELGDVLDRLQEAGGAPGVAELVGAITRLADAEALAFAYDNLSAEPYALGVQTVLARTRGTLDAGLRCGGRGGLGVGTGSNCVWAEIGGHDTTSDGSSETFAYDLSGGTFRVGVQGAFDAGLSYGLFLGRDTVRGAAGPGRSIENGRVTQGGAILRREIGAAMLSGAVSFGRASFEQTRDVALPEGLGGRAEATQKMSFVAAKARIERDFPVGAATVVTPSLDLDATWVRQRALTETGGGLGRLSLDARGDAHAFVSPAIEARRTFGAAGNVLGSARLGVTHRLTGDPAVSGRLAGAPGALMAFESFAGIDDPTTLDLDVGLEMRTSPTGKLSLGIGARVGETVRERRASIT